MCLRYKQLLAIGGVCMGALLAPATQAAHLMPWTGTANYLDASGSTGDEESVGPFSSYDFSSGGMALIRPSSVGTPGTFTVGDTYQGYYQASVTRHMLGSSTVASPNLNTTGSGSGYELTVGADFMERVSGVDSFGNPTFEVTGGTASIYLDTNPDHDAMAGTGYTNGTEILKGSISEGEGTYLNASGIGVSYLQVAFEPVSSDVFNPATLAGAQGVFTLQRNPGATAGVTGVLGNTVSTGDLVLTADGNLELTAVPLPAPIWLLGVALAGLGVVARRRSNNGEGTLVPTAA